METRQNPEAPEPGLSAAGVVDAPLATAAALDSSTFAGLNPNEAIPATWEERARKAWEYYLEEPLVKNCVNSWRTFAVGDEIKLSSDDKALKDEAIEAAWRLRVSRFVKDMVLQLLVKGDAVGFKRYAESGRDIEELVCVNPVSVKVKYAQGDLVELRQFAEDKSAGDEGVDLPVEQVIHLKWDAPAFSPRGNSLVLPAFQSIELLRDYRRAEQAIAKRWTTPFRLLKVGGAFGQKMVMPDQRMLEQVRDMVNKMDLKSGLVVPFYVTVETHGTEGQVLKVEDKVKEVKEDIVVALGLSRSLVTGDGPNFATASVSMQKMMVMIREIKQAARALLDWVFDDWMELHGHGDKTLQYLFNDLDPSDAVDMKRLLLDLYDRKLISRSSLQLKMDLDPEIETSNRATEGKTIDLFDEKLVKPIVDMVMAGKDGEPDQIAITVKEYGRFKASETSKIFDNTDFGYTRVTVERPLRLRFEMTAETKARFLDAYPHLRGDVTAIEKALGLGPLRDWNAVHASILDLLHERKSAWKKPEHKLFRDVFTQTDPEAEPVLKAGRGEGFEPDAALRDFENVPLKEDMSNISSCLAALPQSWHAKPLRAVADYTVSNVDKVPSDDEVPVRLCNYTDVYNNDHINLSMDFMQSTATAGEIEKFHLRVGDVVITKDSESWDDIGVPALVTETDDDLVCAYHLAILRPRSGVLDGRFLFRCLQAKPVRVQLELSANGVTRFGIPKNAIGLMVLPVPSVEKQRAIADYLDREAGRLDALVAAKERLLELLAEKRRALITRAVTRGLNLNAPLRDSGLPWLGQIPKHWEVVPLRYLVSFVSGATPDKGNAEFWNGEIPWVSPKDMKRDIIADSEDHVTEEALEASTLRLLPVSTVLIVVRGMILAHSFPTALTSSRVTINQDMKGLCCREQIEPLFLRDFFKGITPVLVSLMEESAHGTKKMETEVLGNLGICAPPLSEQRAIVAHIERETGKLDALRSATERTVALLKERRAALIAAAVTGQIDSADSGKLM